MKNIIDLLKSVGAVLTDDHFVYTSGKHGSVYINKDALYPHTALSSEVGFMIAQKHVDADIHTVCGPALGGVILSQWSAYHLSKMKNKEVVSVYTEKDAKGMHHFSRGYGQFVKNKNVLVVEDLTTTGGSVKNVVEEVASAGGHVVAVCVMVNRSPHMVNSSLLGVPFSSLGELVADAVEAKDCRLCKNGVPINTAVGHGKKFIELEKNR